MALAAPPSRPRRREWRLAATASPTRQADPKRSPCTTGPRDFAGTRLVGVTGVSREEIVELDGGVQRRVGRQGARQAADGVLPALRPSPASDAAPDVVSAGSHLASVPRRSEGGGRAAERPRPPLWRHDARSRRASRAIQNGG